MLSGLAVAVAAGDTISLYRQRLISKFWAALLLLPPLAGAVGRWRSYRGPPAAIFRPHNRPVRWAATSPKAFSARTATSSKSLPAIQILRRSSRFIRSRGQDFIIDANPIQSPWLTPKDIAEKGAVVVWRATDLAGTPPPEIRQRFPNLVPVLPRPFEDSFRAARRCCGLAGASSARARLRHNN